MISASSEFPLPTVVPLRVALRIARLSPSRYHGWRRGETRCELDDRSSCPRSTPTRLTAAEARAVKEMVESNDHRHLSLRALALYAQRIGRVVASPSTWSRLVRKGGWRRPRRRVYPAKPKVGIRADAPNELWHIDVTIIRLLDGTRACVAVASPPTTTRFPVSGALRERELPSNYPGTGGRKAH